MIEQTPDPFVPFPADQAAWSSWVNELTISKVCGFTCASIEPGRVQIDVERSPWPLNPNGAVHGGLVLAMADHVMGIATFTVMEPERICATADLTAQFHRPAFAPLAFEAVVERKGRTLAFVELTVKGGDGRVCTRGIGSWSIDRTPPARSALEGS